MAKSVIKLSSLAVSTTEDGTWENSKMMPGARFKVRPVTYPAFAIARDQMQQRMKRQHGDSIPIDVTSPALGRLVSEHLLLGWEGFDTEYTPDLAQQLMTDPEYRELVSAVVEVAIDAASAKVEYVDDAGKN